MMWPNVERPKCVPSQGAGCESTKGAAPSIPGPGGRSAPARVHSSPFCFFFHLSFPAQAVGEFAVVPFCGTPPDIPIKELLPQKRSGHTALCALCKAPLPPLHHFSHTQGKVTPSTLASRCFHSFGLSPASPVPLSPGYPTLAPPPGSCDPSALGGCRSLRIQGELPPLGCAGLCASLQRWRLRFSRSISSSSSLSIWTLLHQESLERKAINTPRVTQPCDASQPILLFSGKVILHSLIASHYLVQSVNVHLRGWHSSIDMLGDNTGVGEELFKTVTVRC